MDNQSFITLSKFTVEARKVIGTVNPAKLIKDPAYSEAIFQKIDASDNTELILLGLELRNQLGMLDGDKANAVPEKTLQEGIEKTITPALPAEKYMFGARG
jgi:hypothetical protein